MLSILKLIICLMVLLLGIIIGIAIVLIIFSRGKLAPIKNKQGDVLEKSIAEKIKVDINGLKQGLFIVGENINNPIVLFLHGGPGSPEYIWFSQYLQALEQHYTIAYWDQRGAGMSYYFKMADFTVEDLVEDTKAVSQYLIHRFKQQQIYLVGHSWGTFLGIKTVAQYPDLYKAYIGIAQIANQLLSEKLTYHYLMQKSISEEDHKNIKFLKKYDVDNPQFSLDFSYMEKRNKLLQQYGMGMTRQKLASHEAFKILFTFPGYTALEKVKLILGSIKHYKLVWKPLILDGDLMSNYASLTIPIYIVHGVYDYQVTYQLSKEYFDLISAPKKELITFTHSTHTPFVDENIKFIELMASIKTEVENKLL